MIDTCLNSTTSQQESMQFLRRLVNRELDDVSFGDIAHALNSDGIDYCELLEQEVTYRRKSGLPLSIDITDSIEAFDKYFGIEKQEPSQGWILTLESQAEKQLPPKKKKTHTTHARTTIQAKGLTAVSIRSDILSSKIERGLLNQDDYEQDEERNCAFYTHQFEIKQQKGQVILSICAGRDEEWDAVIEALQTLGDECLDTYTALIAICIQKKGSNGMRTAFEVSPDDILEVCQKSKSHGSYTAESRARVIKHLKTLSQTFVTATIPSLRISRKRGKEITEPTIKIERGALIDLGSHSIAEYSTITGEELSKRISILIGPWAKSIPGLSDKIALLPLKVLGYKAKNQRYHKRLGYYLTKMFRINAHRNRGRFHDGISMKALFDGAGISTPRERGAFMDAINAAFDQLKKDGVIGDYEYEPVQKDIEQRINERARGWFDLYLNSKMNFSPPQGTLDQYKNFMQEDESESEELV